MVYLTSCFIVIINPITCFLRILAFRYRSLSQHSLNKKFIFTGGILPPAPRDPYAKADGHVTVTLSPRVS